ncbi:MAG: ABC transporter permease [Clostridiales bacterium]|nr:ABC transporter permease [Clostridiales bacterium]
MAFLDNIALAFESLRMNKMRAILTMLGIIIGIGSVIAINTVGTSLTNSVSSSMSSLGATSITVSLTQKSDSDESTSDGVKIKQFASENPSDSDLITDEMIEAYKTAFPDDVKYVELTCSVGTGTVTSSSDSSSDGSVTVMGTNDDYADAEEINILYGRYIDNEKDSDRKVCVVSDTFVEDTLSLSAREVIGEKICVTINNVPYYFYIEGVYEYEDDTASTSEDEDTSTVTEMYLPMATAQVITGSSSGYQTLTVVTSSETDTSTFMDTTAEYFSAYYTQNDTWTCEASSLETIISTLTEMVDTISYAIAAIAAISLIVGGIGVMNIMLVSITERTKEIGTRKALGASNGSIRLQFITEAVVICLIGGIIGVIFGIGIGAVISNVLGYSASPAISSIAIAVGFSMLVGVIFGYAPANKAAKLNPIDALRYE